MATSWLRRSLLRHRGPTRPSSAPTQAGEPAAATDEKLWYLQQINIFADMTDAEMRRLAERTVMRRYPRGAVIAQQDDPANVIYLVKEGRVKLCRYSPAGRVQILALLERGDLFGERGLVGTPAATHCEAFEDTLICVLRKEDFEDLVRSNPALALRVIRVLAERLRTAEEAIESLALQNVPVRLATLLRRLAEEYGEAHALGRRLALRLTHHDLASMIGASRETVTTLLNRLRDEGAIAIEDRHIIIRNPDRLHPHDG